jgi:hypothetical protein
VRDDGTVSGRALDAGTQDDVHRALQAARDIGRYSITQVAVDARVVGVIAVARRREGFAQTSSGVVRVRRGSRDDPLFGTELVRFANERTSSRYETTVIDVRLDAVDSDATAVSWIWVPETPLLYSMCCPSVGKDLSNSEALRVSGAGAVFSG